MAQRQGCAWGVCGTSRKPGWLEQSKPRGREIKGEITEVGGKSVLVYFHCVYIIFLVSFFLWKDIDFLFAADTKVPF